MRFEWVNHASFVIDSETNDGARLRILCDPWLGETAFDDGWSLLSPSKFSFQDFSSITHIWFSHEHPDHFHPPTLSKIDKRHRKDISILFQETRDGKVAGHCRELGFKEVILLKSGRWHRLSDSFSILCNSHGMMDSWCCFKADSLTILNLNDCILDQKNLLKYIRSLVGNVDVLLSQFSYAQWIGNRNDSNLRRGSAASVLNRLNLQVRTIKPAYTIPFASFVRYCHRENAYMNDGMNTIRDVVRAIDKDTARPLQNPLR